MAHHEGKVLVVDAFAAVMQVYCFQRAREPRPDFEAGDECTE
jgi:hypothetical protein